MEVLKTSDFVLGFQHFLRDIVNVNERKSLFDPSNLIAEAFLTAHRCTFSQVFFYIH